MTSEKAAELICRGLDRNRSLIVFPHLMTRIGGLLPDRILADGLWVHSASRYPMRTNRRKGAIATDLQISKTDRNQTADTVRSFSAPS